jgi:AcrR family transcriptional regulator
MASVTRQRSAPRRPTSAESRVLAAVEKMLHDGVHFTEMSVQMIAAEAGIARATFYTHFRDKVQVLSMLADVVKERMVGMAEQWDPSGPDGGVEGFQEFFEKLIAAHRQNYAVMSALRELGGYDPEVRDFYMSNLVRADAAVLKSLVAEQREGRTPDDLDPTTASRVIVWGGEEAIIRHIGVDDGGGDEALARELAHIWWYGAYRRRAQSGLE